MAAITITKRSANPHSVTVTTLSASDTLAYEARKNMELLLENTTASPVTATIDGSAASAAFPIPGTGGMTVDLSSGKAIQVPGVVGATVRVPLDSLSNFLQGNIVVTGGVGLTARVLSD